MVPMPENRIWVDAWSPEYGSSSEVDDGLPASEEDVNPYVETTEWRALVPAATPARETAFIDGVDRVDARAFLGDEKGVAPGLFGSVGAGAVISDGRARFDSCTIQRWTVFGRGADPQMRPLDASLSYGGRSVHGSRPEELRAGLQKARENLEEDLGRDLARQGLLVVADGPMRVREPLDLVGYIKSHQKTYLRSDHEPVAIGLRTGERTPVFEFGMASPRPRYSWYTRIAAAPGQHPWAAVARCEVSATVGLDRAIGLADEVSWHLPRFASKAFWDTRAPQNLVPIASLERKLWSLLGDRELILRRIRSGVRAYA
jgi:hypothetical protein